MGKVPQRPLTLGISTRRRSQLLTLDRDGFLLVRHAVAWAERVVTHAVHSIAVPAAYAFGGPLSANVR
jgi:hypothetical protein